MFALKLALRPWKLQPLSQILTFLTVGIMLLLAGFFGTLATNLPEIRDRLAGDHVASVFLDPAMEIANLDSIRDQIRISLGSSPVKMSYVDSDAFLLSIQAAQPELAKEIAAMGSEKDWIAPKYFSLRGTLDDRQIDRLKNIPGVEAVSFSAKRFKPIVDNLAAIEWLSRVLFASIVFAMVSVLALLGRLNSAIFTEAEAIIAQMGGNAWQARFPSRLNPFLLAGGAGIVATLFFVKLSPWFTTKMATLSPFLAGMDDHAKSSVWAMLGLGFGTALLTVLVSPKAGKVVR